MTQPKRPSSWSGVSLPELKPVRAICLDIDETLSTSGKLTSEAYAALWSLKKAGFIVIPITGRPAGWCDHFARFWPVDAVVGENGAFTFFMEKGIRKRLDTPAGEDAAVLQAKLRALGEKIRKRFSHATWASDQAYREFDLAIDICEDVPTWNRNEIDELLALCRAEGANAKLSSIHVNTWFGNYDKRRGLEHWLKTGAPGISAECKLAWDELLFIGDSPNDESMFASFQYSVGVANLRQYLDRLAHPPRWITDSESGAGFSEMAAKMVASRQI
ncbi:MAG TPA: HAD-IIB family hydrolase [Bdellovibrionota bacterium]|nr:HAD-IIB family hydrolase [Bdellovibrionota bacterium]